MTYMVTYVRCQIKKLDGRIPLKAWPLTIVDLRDLSRQKIFYAGWYLPRDFPPYSARSRMLRFEIRAAFGKNIRRGVPFETDNFFFSSARSPLLAECVATRSRRLERTTFGSSRRARGDAVQP